LHDLLFVPGSQLLFAAAQIVAQCLCQALFLRGPFGSLCRGQVRKIFHFAMQQKRDEHVKRRPASRPAALVKHPAALPNLKAWYIRLGIARCRSSVVEHSLGKGEVESSILSGSTIDFQWLTNAITRNGRRDTDGIPTLRSTDRSGRAYPSQYGLRSTSVDHRFWRDVIGALIDR
jgi:hypothetical protein